jgi:hypothetical protein
MQFKIITSFLENNCYFIFHDIMGHYNQNMCVLFSVLYSRLLEYTFAHYC